MAIQQFPDIAAWATKNVELSMFYLLSILAIPLAYGVILDKVIIRSGFVLIGVFGIISGLFLLLQAQFLALAQVMIYAVGITLVVVIALMLTNPKMESEMNPSNPAHRTSGVLMAVFIFLTIFLSLRSEKWPIDEHLDNVASLTTANLERLGTALMTTYALPFEFASVLLLAALMGAVMLAKADPVSNDAEEETAQSTVSSRQEV